MMLRLKSIGMLLFKILSYEDVKRLMVFLLRQIAKRTDTEIDDKICDLLEKRLGVEDGNKPH